MCNPLSRITILLFTVQFVVSCSFNPRYGMQKNLQAQIVGSENNQLNIFAADPLWASDCLMTYVKFSNRDTNSLSNRLVRVFDMPAVENFDIYKRKITFNLELPYIAGASQSLVTVVYLLYFDKAVSAKCSEVKDLKSACNLSSNNVFMAAAGIIRLPYTKTDASCDSEICFTYTTDNPICDHL